MQVKIFFKKLEKWSSFKIIFYTILLYIFVMFFMIGIVKPDGLNRYFYQNNGLFDVEIYVKLATVGYNSVGSFAMFPLWPLIIKAISTLFSSKNYMLIANLTALTLFFISLPILWAFLKSVFDKKMALLLFLCFVFNPFSVFHSLGYSESLTTLEFSIWLLLLHKLFINKVYSLFTRNLYYFLLITVSYCIGLSRPVFMQLFLSVFFTLILMILLKSKIKKFILPLFISITSLFLGFFTFALFSYAKGFGLLASFKAQNSWDRILGFHWKVIFHPHSVGGSDNVLNWDLQAFWFPLIIFIISLFVVFKKKYILNENQKSLKMDIIFWIALFYCCAHSAIQFLTYDLFFSTSRFIFALPLFYYVIGKFMEEFHLKYKYQILTIYLIYSFSFFVYWWTRFSREGWMG